jgi:hypothetical protein
MLSSIANSYEIEACRSRMCDVKVDVAAGRSLEGIGGEFEWQKALTS